MTRSETSSRSEAERAAVGELEAWSLRAIPDATVPLEAEDALGRILQQIDQLCQRQDANQIVTELLRQFDLVTKLSAWTEPRQLN